MHVVAQFCKQAFAEASVSLLKKETKEEVQQEGMLLNFDVVHIWIFIFDHFFSYTHTHLCIAFFK